MANPTATARQIPVGFKMPDGYRTLVIFASHPAVQLWEKEVTPMGVDGGDKIDTCTMLNSVWRTFDFKHLKTVTDVTYTAAFDPDVIGDCFVLVNRNQSVTVVLPDASTEAFWGGMLKFMPQGFKEGEMPLAQVTVGATNWDPNAFVEAGPVFTPAGGT